MSLPLSSTLRKIRVFFALALVFLACIPLLVLVSVYGLLSDLSLEEKTVIFKGVISSIIFGLVCMSAGMIFVVRAFRMRQGTAQPVDREMDMLGSSLHGVIDRLKEQEEKAMKKVFFAEKMAAIGEMSAGLAHEMNNVLMPIQGYAKMLGNHLEGPDKEKIDIIYENVSYGIDIIKNMLTFARATEQKVVSVNIISLIHEAERLLHYQIEKKRIAMTLPPQENICTVEVDPNQFRQVLTNLFLNAIHAVGEKGSIEVNLWKEKDFVKLAVKDNGCGMDPDLIRQIFKPFVTKREGGIGLGLSVTYSIIQFHGGDIEVASAVGKGTTFTITLPMYRL